MSRVWKKFFLKIGKAIGIIVLCIFVFVGSVFGLTYLGVNPGIATAISTVTLVILPMVVSMLRLIYEDCQDEVRKENRDILRSMGDRF